MGFREAFVVEGHGDKLMRRVIDSKGGAWYHGPVVQLINEVYLCWMKNPIVGNEGKSRIVVKEEDNMGEN